MASRSLRKLTREPPSAEDVQHLLSDLANVDDRATAIIMGTMVEDALRALVISGMRKLDTKQRDDLFGPEKPLGSFSAKLRIAHAFDLIDTASADRVGIIKDIRNTFAHAPRRISFDTPAIAATIDKLKIQGFLVHLKRADRPLVPSDSEGKFRNRETFITMCQFFEINLTNAAEYREHLRRQPPQPSQEISR